MGKYTYYLIEGAGGPLLILYKRLNVWYSLSNAETVTLYEYCKKSL